MTSTTQQPSATDKPSDKTAWVTATPALFVLLWSTGFIGAKLGLPYAEPLTFLLIRYTTLSILLIIASLISRAPWPSDWLNVFHIAITGLLVHATYLGGVFVSISLGLSAGLSALIVGTQPLLTAVIAKSFLGEKVSRKQWLGLIIGFLGVSLVVAQKVSFDSLEGYGLLAAIIGLFGITLGTLYQKKHGGDMDLRSGSAIQFIVSSLAMLALAPLFETMNVVWSGEFIFALAWLVLVLSVGAISLLYLLIRRGAASKVASLFYLVPPITAIIAYFLFNETVGPLALIGMAITVVGVALVIRT